MLRFVKNIYRIYETYSRLEPRERAAALENYPFVVLLVWNPWFRRVLFVSILIGMSTLIALPRIWRSTPQGIFPIIRISLVDKGQAWSLERSAKKARAEQRLDDAIYSWRAAIANHPGNLDLTRELFKTLNQAPELADDDIKTGISMANWLLQLSSSNNMDTVLVSEFYQRNGLHQRQSRLLGFQVDSLTPSQMARYLESLFWTDQYPLFTDLWKPSLEDENDKLGLYSAMIKATQSPKHIQTVKDMLNQKRGRPGFQSIEPRLNLRVCKLDRDAEGCQMALQRLEGRNAATASDHALYWWVLHDLGRASEAKTLAARYVKPPATPQEARFLSQTLSQLGMNEIAINYLDDALKQFPSSYSLWESRADFFARQRKWENLRRFALTMRSTGQSDSVGQTYSYFLEGIAEDALKRTGRARDAFAIAANGPFANRDVGLRVAQHLFDSVRPDLARIAMQGLESQSADQPSYWALLIRIATELNAAELLLKASTAAFNLNPDGIQETLHYSAALLTNRVKAPESIALTTTLRNINPNSVEIQINHAFSLIQNYRLADAESLLSAIQEYNLVTAVKPYFHYAWFQVHLGQKRFEKAKEESEKVDETILFDTERLWFRQALETLSNRQGR